ncbi:MAG TPA: hypothetical protein VJ745_06780 [Gaiellaceae bacterium]|nr:hypothetical protein [Gaiellaceae bacterium]
MPERSIVVYQCPGCGKPIAPGEDYVAAREYALAPPDFSLHIRGHHPVASVRRRFHVEHFRGRIGGHFYELVDEEASR